MEIHLRGVPLAVRGGVEEEPSGIHALVGRGDDLPALLAQVARRPDCVALAVVGAGEGTVPAPVVERLSGRVLLLDDLDPELLRAWLLPVPAVLLAAGAGSRMGGGKLLRPLGGRPLVAWALDAARAGGVDGVWLVYADAAVRDVARGIAHPVFNPDAARGQASSLAAGLLALPGHAAGAIVVLGDQPLVGAGTIRTLLDAWRAPGAPPAVAARYGGGGWLPPVVLGRSLWTEALRLTGDEGARAIFRRRPELVGAVPVPGRPEDADTPDDLERIQRLVLE